MSIPGRATCVPPGRCSFLPLLWDGASHSSLQTTGTACRAGSGSRGAGKEHAGLNSGRRTVCVLGHRGWEQDVWGALPWLSHAKSEPPVGVGGPAVARPLPCRHPPPALGTWQALGMGRPCFHGRAGSHRPQRAHAEDSRSVGERLPRGPSPGSGQGLVVDPGRGGLHSSVLVRAAAGSRCETPHQPWAPRCSRVAAGWIVACHELLWPRP